MSEVTVNAKIGDETILFQSKEDALTFIANYATFEQFQTYCVELEVSSINPKILYPQYKSKSRHLTRIYFNTMTDKNRSLYDMLRDKTS